MKRKIFSVMVTFAMITALARNVPAEGIVIENETGSETAPEEQAFSKTQQTEPAPNSVSTKMKQFITSLLPDEGKDDEENRASEDEDENFSGAVLTGGNGNDAAGLPSNDENDGIEVALDDLDISVRVDGFVLVREDEDGFVYIYTEDDDYIPYVILGCYDMAYEKIADAFTDSMTENYPGLDVDLLQEGLELGDREYTKVIYHYQVNNYNIDDTRLFCEYNNKTFMFGMKEIQELDDIIGEDYLESVARSISMLAGGYDDYKYHVLSDKPLLFEDIDEKGLAGAGKEDAPKKDEKKPDQDDKEKTVFYEEDAPYDGVWVPFEDGFQLYFPADWSYLNITQEQKEAGIILIAADTSIPEEMPLLNVSFAYDETIDGLEGLTSYIDNAGYITEGIYTVNDIVCLIYHDAALTFRGEIFLYPLDEDSGFFLSVGANYYQNDKEAFDAILMSLKRTEE